jgi:hypothetical protein
VRTQFSSAVSRRTSAAPAPALTLAPLLVPAPAQTRYCVMLGNRKEMYIYNLLVPLSPEISCSAN